MGAKKIETGLRDGRVTNERGYRKASLEYFNRRTFVLSHIVPGNPTTAIHLHLEVFEFEPGDSAALKTIEQGDPTPARCQ